MQLTQFQKKLQLLVYTALHLQQDIQSTNLHQPQANAFPPWGRSIPSPLATKHLRAAIAQKHLRENSDKSPIFESNLYITSLGIDFGDDGTKKWLIHSIPETTNSTPFG
jgi:hypothetical protein